MKKFNLKECRSGVRCVTKSGREATFLFIQNMDSWPTKHRTIHITYGNAPLVMLVNGRMENYTLDGKHLFDTGMDLSVKEPIEFNIYSPTIPEHNTKEFLDTFYGYDDRNCLNLGFAETAADLCVTKTKIV